MKIQAIVILLLNPFGCLKTQKICKKSKQYFYDLNAKVSAKHMHMFSECILNLSLGCLIFFKNTGTNQGRRRWKRVHSGSPWK